MNVTCYKNVNGEGELYHMTQIGEESFCGE